MANRKAPRNKTFFEELTAAVNYYLDRGWEEEDALLSWSTRLRRAALRENQNTDVTRAHLTGLYKRLVTDGGILKNQPSDGISAVTLRAIKPALRAELDRRIFASTSLIKLNREQAVERTLQRFQGWATSIPPGGAAAIDKVEQKQAIRKSLLEQSYINRRLAIDQGHKLVSNITYLTSIQGGAIAFIWRSNWRRPGYQFRLDHKERDERIYLIRDSWAVQQGLIKPVNGYYDDITAAGEEVSCSCKIHPVYSPQRLPDEFLTEKGKHEFNRA
ncbi:hypothetical protein [Serratia fonticola]|uniref:hypothetical protein n=1 Tax=Serratia fonticola TaxID=47917 RepID=UPI00301C2B3D